MDPLFFRPSAPRSVTTNHLPHWQQSGTAYFITFRLADALPAFLTRDWSREFARWLRFHPKPWSSTAEREYLERFARRGEEWLDAGHGACVFREPKFARMVGDTLNHFNGDRYDQLAWVVMPNHVHVALCPLHGHTVADIIRSWKVFSAKCVNAALGRSGPLWQKDYFVAPEERRESSAGGAWRVKGA
jgi:putative transposase